MSWISALAVGLATYHDASRLVQAVILWRRLRLPVVATSTAVLAVRLPALWWAYLGSHWAAYLLLLFVGQTVYLLAYRLDMHALRYAVESQQDGELGH